MAGFGEANILIFDLGESGKKIWDKAAEIWQEDFVAGKWGQKDFSDVGISGRMGT
jgi:hypothetical protein